MNASSNASVGMGHYVGNKARLAGQPGSEPRSPASWPKVGLKPLAVAGRGRTRAAL